MLFKTENKYLWTVGEFNTEEKSTEVQRCASQERVTVS